MTRKTLTQLGAWIIAGLLAVFAGLQPANAQTGWSANLFLQPFPSPYLSDWENNPSIGSLTVFNNTGASADVILSLTIIERTRGEIARGSSLPITVPPSPPPTQIQSDRFIDWSTVSYNKSIETQAVRSGRLPEGEYTACVRIEDRTGGILLDQVCTDFTIVYPDQPQLILPADGEQVEVPYPIFTWTPLQVPASYQIHYELRIAEILPGQTPQRALEANIPQLEILDLLTTSVQYPISALPLERGKSYAWQIRALDQNGFAPSSNQGRSEIWTFQYQGTAGEGDAIVTVVDSSTGEPVASASVVADGTVSRVTDLDGRAYLRNLPVGILELIIRRDGYRTQSASLSIVEGITSRHTVALSRVPDRVAGSVRDFYTDGPLDSVHARYTTLRFQGGGVEEGREELVTHSLQDGSFEFADVPDDDSFLITLSRDGYAQSHGAVIPRSLTGIKKTIIIASLSARYPRLQLLAGPLRCAMVMTPTTAVVSGNVVSDAGDRPIAGAIVEIWKKSPGSSGQSDQGIASTRTDSIGRFRFDGITPGSVYFFRIFVSRRFHPYDTRENPISVARAGFTEGGTHRLHLLRGTVSGVVQSLGTGTPLAEADVIILPQDSLVGQLAPDSSSWAHQVQPVSHLVDPVKTDSLGRFSFERLPINDPGHPTDRYALWTQPPGHDAVWESVRLGDDGERVSVTLRAPVARGAIAGTITSTADGRGVGEAVIEIVYSRSEAENLSGGGHGGVSYSNPDGSFTVPDLKLGEPFTLSVRKAGFEPVTPGEAILLSESERTRTVNFALSPYRGVVRGSVHDADGGPLFDVVVTSPAAPELNASTAADGTFDISGAPAIRLPLLFQLPGYRDTRDTVLVAQGDTTLVRVVMQEYSGALIAHLIDSTTHDVVRNATVSASSSLHAVSDDSGRVMFPRLPVGPVQLRVVPGSAPGDSIDYRTASATAMVNLNDTTLLQIKLLRGARVSGIVRSAGDPGMFIEGARVSVEGMNDVVTASGAGGAFTLRNVPAGDTLTILVSRVGYMTRRIGGIVLSPGERRAGVEVMLERAALSSLYGFQVEVDSVRDAGNGRSVVSGSIVNIPGNGVVELQEHGLRIPFEDLEIDGNGQPVGGYVELMTRSIGVLLYGIPASLADTGETPLRLMASQPGTGVIRTAGGVILFRDHPVATDLAGSRWPDEMASDGSGGQILGLWSDSVYHGPATIALTPAGVVDSTTLFGYRIRVDYGGARIDSSGLHYAGVVAIPGIADTTFSFTDLRIAAEPGSHVVSVAASGFSEQPARFDIGEFEFHNNSLSLTAGGFRTGGFVELPEHGNTRLDFTVLRLSPDGSFRAMDFAKPVDDSLTFGTSRFAVSEVHLAPDSAGKKALLFSGDLVVRAFQLFALRNMFSKPIEFSTLRYDQDGKFDGTTRFNQDVIFLAIFNVKVNTVEFTNDQHGNFIRVDGGIALVIPGLNVHGGNFRFYEDGKFVLDTVGLKFQSPLFTVSGFYVYNDSIGIGGGVELLINPVLYLAASFNYKDATHWGFAITGGRGGPAGGGIQMGAFNLYRVGGKLARSGDAWTVGINCAMAIAKPGATPVKLEPMGIEVTAGGPGGPIITGYGKLVPDSPDTTVKLWQGSLEVRITYDHPQRKFTGSATLEFVRDWKGRDIVTVTGVLALEIKGRTDGGSGIELWYLGGSASVKFLTYEVGNTTFALGQNYPWPHTFDVIYHPDNPVINGIHFDMYVGIPDLNFVIWGARFHFRSFAQMTLGGDPSLSGGINLHASSWLDIWVIRGYASVDFEAGLRYSDCLSFSASAAFRMALYTGCCRSGCSWGVCLACRCKWSQPWCCVAPCGAKACFNVSMNVAYNRDNCNQGWRFSADW